MKKEIIIKTQNLYKSFGKKENTAKVIDNLDIEIYKNDFTIIMGSSRSW